MKTKLTHAQALNLAQRIVNELTAACERIEIAGSIRRQSPTVGDIEIVCVPYYQKDLFGQPNTAAQTPLDIILKQLLSADRLQTPPTRKNKGKRYRQYLIPVMPDLALDLFITTAERWPVIYAIRTGPAEFSRKLVTRRDEGGYLPNNCQVTDGYLWREGARVPLRDEKTFLLETVRKWLKPEERGDYKA